MVIYRENMNRIMAFVLVVAPFANLYSSFIPRIGVCDFAILLFMLYYIVVSFKSKILVTSVMRFHFGIIIVAMTNMVLVGLFGAGINGDIIARTLRYIVYMSVGVFFVNDNKSREFALNIYRLFSIVGTLVIIAQNVIFKIMGIYLNVFLPIWPLMGADGINEQINNIYTMGGRPFAFFSEPSAYAMYVGLFLLLILLGDNMREQENDFLKWFLTVGLILSGATTGLLCVMLAWGCYGIKFLYKKRTKISIVSLLMMGSMPVIIVTLLSSNSVKSMILRIKNMGSVIDRFEGFRIFIEPMTLFNKLLGHGMNDDYTNYFLSGYPRLYYYWGIIGMVFVVVLFIWLIKKVDTTSKIVLGFVVVVNIASVWSWGQFTLLTIALLLDKTNEKSLNNE